MKTTRCFCICLLLLLLQGGFLWPVKAQHVAGLVALPLQSLQTNLSHVVENEAYWQERYEQNSPVINPIAVLRRFDSACIPIVTITASQNNICVGEGITFKATATNGGTNRVFKWKKNGAGVGVDSNNYYTSVDFYDGDVVVCEYRCRTACGVDTTVYSNAITVKVANDIKASITIRASNAAPCQGMPVTFAATATYGTATPVYQWLVNDMPSGRNSPTFTTTLTGATTVSCKLYITTPACPVPLLSQSNVLSLRADPMQAPAITIVASREAICPGESVTFSAMAIGGLLPVYRWSVNGAPVGNNTATFTSSSLQHGDRVRCTVAVDATAACFTASETTSNEIVVQVITAPQPKISIAASATESCLGKLVSFTAATQHTGGAAKYSWKVNGANAGSNAPVFQSSQLVNGDQVFCMLTTTLPGCNLVATANSNTIDVVVHNNPQVSFLPTEITTMVGQPALLQPTISGNVSRVTWEPASLLADPQSLTPQTLPLYADTAFRLTVTDNRGCEASASVLVRVIRKLLLPSSFTPNGDGINDIFRIPPGVSIQLKSFSIFDRWGQRVFTTTDAARGWNGYYRGRSLNAGTFIYLVTGSMAEGPVVLKGTVTLIR